MARLSAAAQALQNAQKEAKSFADELREIENLTSSLSTSIKDATTVDPKESIKNYKQTLRESVNLFDKLRTHQESINKSSYIQVMLGNKSTKLSSSQIESLQDQTIVNRKILTQKYQELKISGELLADALAKARADGNTAAATTLQNQLSNNLKAQESFNKAISESENQAKSLNKEFAKAKVSEGVKKGLDDTKKAAKSVGDTIMGAFGISSLNPLEILLQMFGFAVKVAIDLDNELGEAAKSMNQTYAAAGKSRLAMIDVAEASGELLINSTHIEKTFLALNKTLGTGVAFENMSKSLQKDIAFMAMMENYAGLTATESNNVLKYSLQIGKSAKSTAGILMAQYKAEGIKLGIVLNSKDVLKEIGQISESIKISTAGGAAGLAKALAAAKGLGASLSDVDSAASSLLNFEESIEKEMSAELLLGRDLNLEKARQFALDNNLQGVAEEIKNEVGSAADFALLGRIEQEALAAAVGLTREQLSGALNTQLQQQEISKEAIGAEEAAYNALVAKHGEQGAIGIMMQQQLALQTQQASIQEQIAAAKLKEKDEISKGIIPAMIDLQAMIKKLLADIEKIFDKFGGWKSVLIAIGAILALNLIVNIVSMVSKLGNVYKMLKSIGAQEKVNAGIAIVNSSFSSVGMTPGVGPLLAAAAIGVGMGILGTIAVQDMSDGIIPSTNNSGFGDRVMYGPEGAISFNNKDTIVAGTNLFPKKVNDMTSSPEGTNYLSDQSNNPSEMKTLIDKFDKLSNAIVELASRPVVVEIEGKPFITQIVGGNPSDMGFNLDKNDFKMS